VSPDGTIMAVGDSEGNIRLYGDITEEFNELLCIEAHDSDVTCLDFAPIINEDSIMMRYCLVSGSKDRLVHVYYIKVACGMATYENMAIFEDH